MSGVVIHLVVPTLAVLATGLFPRKKVLMFAPFTLVNDLDFIFNFAGYYLFHTEMLWHRLAFHNLFVGLPTLALTGWIWWRCIRADPTLRGSSFRTRWDAFGSVPWGHAAVLMTVFLYSHVFLDMFQGGVTLLWPLVNLYVYPRLIIWVNTETGAPRVESDVQSGEGAPALSPEYPWITPEQFAILFVAVAGVLTAVWSESRWARASRPPGDQDAGATAEEAP